MNFTILELGSLVLFVQDCIFVTVLVNIIGRNEK